MINFKKFASHAFMALALAMGAAAAQAGPIYHVAINAATFGPGAGTLEFAFAGPELTPTTATVSNLTGALGAATQSAFVIGAAPGDIVFTNGDSYNFLSYAVANIGGMYEFDISFSDFSANTDSLQFLINVINDETLDFFNPVQFTLVAGFMDDEAYLDIFFDDAVATVTEVSQVPEPSQLLLLLTALAIMGAIARRKHLG